MKRTVIYARFSTELQHDRSIEDQVALCRGYAERNDLSIVAVYNDRARSGATVHGREGLMQLLAAARDHAFDVVLVEALDRLSRDQEDLAGIWKRLNFLGVELRAVHEGTADQIQIGVRGLLGSLFLTDLAHKVRRGMQGMSGTVDMPAAERTVTGPVPGKPGELEIVETEAEIVRRIFLRVCQRQDTSGNRIRPQQRRCSPTTRAQMDGLNDQREQEEASRHPSKRTLCRPHRLEPCAHGEGSRYRAPNISAQPVQRTEASASSKPGCR
jgi:DNA invertase Pin-like site-specific DNA recombinase